MELSRSHRHPRDSESNTHRHRSSSRSPPPSRSHSSRHSHPHHRDGHRHHRSRTRSPEGSRHHHHHHHHHRHHHSSHGQRDKREVEKEEKRRRPVILPFEAQELSKHHLERYRPLFASYLDIQKGLDIDEIEEGEVKGRWKSFVGKWNRGELAEGWYDPETLEKAISNAHSFTRANADRRRSSPVYSNDDEHDDEHHRSISASPPPPPSAINNGANEAVGQDQDEDEDEDLYGPTLPSNTTTTLHAKPGPTNPNLQDIRMKHESERYERETSYEARQATRRAERTLHKAEAKQLVEDLAPRSEPGTRERRLEKKREANASNRAFAEARRGGSPVAEVGDEMLMGGGAGGAGSDLAMLKKEKEKMERKKNERELRREEILRARMAEREERLRNYRAREDSIIEKFRAVAKRRFGTPDGEE